MSGVGENSKVLNFKYESDASSSFLVIECETSIIGYQAKMLENNTIPYIVPGEAVKAEGTYHLYFNITSKISLSMYLKRYKLNRMEFLKMLLNLISCINNSAGYLLSASNFVYNPDYVYIEPETMEVRLVYIPAEVGDNAGGKLQTLVTDLLMQHIHEEGFGSGNLVQRILSEVRSEMFNIKGLMILINDLLYGDEADGVPVQLPVQSFNENILENSSRKDKIEEKQEDKENNSQKISLYLIIPAVLLQFLMGGAIFICRGFLDNIGENRTTTYAAVVMIVIAIDVLIFRRLQALKLFSTKSIEGIQELIQMNKPKPADDVVPKPDSIQPGNIQPGMVDKPAEASLQGVYNVKPEDIASSAVKAHERLKKLTQTSRQENAREDVDSLHIDYKATAGQEDMAERYMQKTEILSSHTNDVPILKSKGRLAGDRDIVIDRNEIIIGRLQGHVDHVLLNSAVGKLHAELIYRNGECFVKDLNSINGTFVNNIRIDSNKEVALKNNDNLQFANSEFIFVCGQSCRKMA